MVIAWLPGLAAWLAGAVACCGAADSWRGATAVASGCGAAAVAAWFGAATAEAGRAGCTGAGRSGNAFNALRSTVTWAKAGVAAANMAKDKREIERMAKG